MLYHFTVPVFIGGILAMSNNGRANAVRRRHRECLGDFVSWCPFFGAGQVVGRNSMRGTYADIAPEARPRRIKFSATASSFRGGKTAQGSGTQETGSNPRHLLRGKQQTGADS